MSSADPVWPRGGGSVVTDRGGGFANPPVVSASAFSASFLEREKNTSHGVGIGGDPPLLHRT